MSMKTSKTLLTHSETLAFNATNINEASTISSKHSNQIRHPCSHNDRTHCIQLKSRNSPNQLTCTPHPGLKLAEQLMFYFVLAPKSPTPNSSHASDSTWTLQTLSFHHIPSPGRSLGTFPTDNDDTLGDREKEDPHWYCHEFRVRT